MSYSSYEMKKKYKKETDIRRKKNLKRLREDIANLSQRELCKKTGITKNDISMLESGDKLLSLFHIQAYRNYFLDSHDIALSVDYLMGFTDIMENNNMDFQNEIGLSNDALETLKTLCGKNETYSKLAIDTLNVLLADMDRFVSILLNTRLIITPETWVPCIAINNVDNDEKNNDTAYYENLAQNQFIAFRNDNNFLLEIDDTILKSNAFLTIQRLLNEYQKGGD